MKPPLRIPWSACRCGDALFFPNTRCLGCGAETGFDPAAGRVMAVIPGDGAGILYDPNGTPGQYRFCQHRDGPLACNWLLAADDSNALCESCRLTRTIPDLQSPGAEEKWSQAELAKRRVLAGLRRLGISFSPLTEGPGGLAFDLLIPAPGGPPVMTGHSRGVITLNLDEADHAAREAVRQQMSERYRTLEGHFRHEIAHCLWEWLAADREWLARFTANFGDPRADYAAALERHHREGPLPGWEAQFISAYASSHPWEDWAETTAHYLHATEGVQTARSLGLNPASIGLDVESFPAGVLGDDSGHREARTFLRTLDGWVRLGLLLNELNRALGQQDAYPFIYSAPMVRKLWMVHLSLRILAEQQQQAPESAAHQRAAA